MQIIHESPNRLQFASMSESALNSTKLFCALLTLLSWLIGGYVIMVAPHAALFFGGIMVVFPCAGYFISRRTMVTIDRPARTVEIGRQYLLHTRREEISFDKIDGFCFRSEPDDGLEVTEFYVALIGGRTVDLGRVPAMGAGRHDAKVLLVIANAMVGGPQAIEATNHL
jgi:hypothetical protein